MAHEALGLHGVRSTRASSCRLRQPAASDACPYRWPLQVSAYVDNHLPQPDVQGWRQRQRAALREAEAVTRRSLRRVLAEREAQVAGGRAREPAARLLLPLPCCRPGCHHSYSSVICVALLPCLPALLLRCAGESS